MDSDKYNVIKEVLVRKGKSQKWLAEAMGRTPNTIASICNNKSQPNISDLFRIAELLDVNPGDLLTPIKKKDSISPEIIEAVLASMKAKGD